MSTPAQPGTSQGLKRWAAAGAAAAALGLLLWARLIITAQLPREAVAEDPPAVPGAADGERGTGGDRP